LGPVRVGNEELALAYYVGILDGSKDVWGVRIPDVPGCYGGGATPEAALADATSALREFAAHQAAKGIALKPPRSVQGVIRDETAEFDAAAGEAIVLVALILDQARPVKANISLDAGLLEAIDDEAERRGLTRSSFLTSAAVAEIVGTRVDEDVTTKGHLGKVSKGRARIAAGGLREKSKPRGLRGAHKERARGKSSTA
jgi:predicted RNase H-like HicB family nuclease